MMVRRHGGGGVGVGQHSPTRSGDGLAAALSGSRKFHTSGSGSVTSTSESPGPGVQQSDTGDTSDNKSSKLDTLHNIRYKLEHNQISRSEVDKSEIFDILNLHLDDPDQEIQHTALQLIQDILPHLGSETDTCMSIITENLMSCLGSHSVILRKTTVHILQIYLRFSSDVQAVIRCIVNHGLESSDRRVIHETLISVPILFPPDFDSRYGNKNLYLLVSGLARRLVEVDTRMAAFISMQKISDVVGAKTFSSYISKLTPDQKKIYDELEENRTKNDATFDQSSGIIGKRITAGWVEFGAIDHIIIEKLQNEDEPRVRLQGAEELHRCIRNMSDFSPLQQQIRHFLNFLESILDEKNFKMNLLILEIYQILLDQLKGKLKPNIRSFVSALLKHASNNKVVVRIENYKVLEKLMLAMKPNTVINHLLDHLGDKKAVVRESILNMIMFGLLTFPSNEFDLKNIAATVVPTLVDPKRRVRHAALEAVSILAAFLGPSKAVPLIRAIELLESHFEKGVGVLTAVQARLARRQLPRVTSEGLIEYSLQIPSTATRSDWKPSPQRGGSSKWGSDVDWILAGSGSISSGSARSVPRSESRLDSSVGSGLSGGSPTSPVQVNGTHVPWSKSSLNSSFRSSGGRRSRSEESRSMVAASPRENGYDWRTQNQRSNTESDFKNRGFQILPSKMQAGSSNAWSAKYKSNDVLPNLEGNSITAIKKEPPYSMNKRWDASSGSSSGTGRKTSPESELPRLIGTKSQASTASSSATRDSGISMTERHSDMDTVSDKLQRSRAGSVAGKPKWRNGNGKGSGQISVDTLPVTGQAVNLTRRGSTDSLDSVDNRNFKISSRMSSVKNGKSNSSFRKNVINNNNNVAKVSNNINDEDVVMTPVHDVNGDASPRTPRNEDILDPPHIQTSLLLRPVDNSPFSSRSKRGKSASSDNLSTPYSQISGISTYDYEDDFTSDESEFSAMTNKSKARSSSQSKIPIKRSSSLHRRSINSNKNGNSSTTTDKNMNNVPEAPNYVPDAVQDVMDNLDTGVAAPEIGAAEVIRTPTTKLSRKKATPRKINPRTKSVSPHVQARQKMQESRLATAKSTSDIPEADIKEEEEASETVEEKRTFPATEPPKRRSYSHSVSVPGRSYSSVSGPRRSTASSVSSTGSIQTLPLVTVPTLKSPYDGVKITAWSKPDEALEKVLEQLNNNDDWEKNLDGLTGTLRLVHHHPEAIIVEYKQVMQAVLKQVKNLRSQVARAAVHLVGDMFATLKRNMESDLEKIALPLVMKTGETNRFLREDCNQALDKMVENVNPSKSILVITAEPLNSKNAVIRTTVSRLLAYITEKIGPNKALTASKDITERLLPAVAKLAQDGSLEARIYAKMTLKTLMDHDDFERILKKNVTANTLRNLEKVLDSVRSNGLSSASSNKRGFGSVKKRSNNGKTL